MDKLFKKGMYEPDEDFPDDESEFYYFGGQGTQLRKDDKKSEKMKVAIKDKSVDKDLGEALLSEGPLTAGAASEEGGKAVLEALHGEVAKKAPKTKEKKKEEETEALQPKEPWEQLGSPTCMVWVCSHTCVCKFSKQTPYLKRGSWTRRWSRS